MMFKSTAFLTMFLGLYCFCQEDVRDLILSSGVSDNVSSFPRSVGTELYSQIDGSSVKVVNSQKYEAILFNEDRFVADDFVITGESWVIDEVRVAGGFFGPGLPNPVDSVNVFFYADAPYVSGGGTTPPTRVPASIPPTATPISAFLEVVAGGGPDFTITLDPPIVLADGTGSGTRFWVAVQANLDFCVFPNCDPVVLNHQWGVKGHTTLVNEPGVFSQPFGTVCTGWGLITNVECTSSTDRDPDIQFALFGTTLNPLPAINGPLCDGQDLMLTSQTIPGAAYQWTLPDLTTNSNQDFTILNASPSDSGIYSVVATVTAVNGVFTSAAETVEAIVHSLAAPVVTSNLPVCAGGTLQLFAPATKTGARATTYAWSKPPPNPFSSTVQNPVVTTNAGGIHEGEYSLVITADGCVTAAGTIDVLIGPGAGPGLPKPSSPDPELCVGETLNLTVPELAGATYTWTGPGGQSASVREPVFTNVDETYDGTWFVFQTLSGCSSPPGSTDIAVNTLPAAPGVGNDGPVCELSNVQLTSTAGFSHEWRDPGNNVIATTQNHTVTGITVAQAGSYSVTVTDANGCTSPPATTDVVVNPFFLNVPSSNAQGLAALTLEAVFDCGQGATDVEWFDETAGSVSFGLNVNPIVVGPLASTNQYRCVVTDGVAVDIIRTLTILADPAAYDVNGDGQNNVADVGFAAANWPNQSLIHDFDGNGAFNVQDLLFIRTSN